MPEQSTLLDSADGERATGSARRFTGILPCQSIHEMLRAKEITTSVDLLPEQIQPASIDLRLGNYAYPVGASFLPGKDKTVMEKMQELDERFDEIKIPLKNGAVLEKNIIYVVPLLEAVNLKSEVDGFANPKSSTGRLDILTRLISDRATVFDQVTKGYKGQLYLEIAPQSFSIFARTGDRLNQLRFRRSRGATPEAITSEEWGRLIEKREIVSGDYEAGLPGETTGMLRFTIDLKGTGVEGDIVGYRAKKHTRRIDLSRRDYDPLEFWEPIRFHKQPSLILSPDDFYILMTKEAVAVPPDYAAEMMPYDTRAGEFRVHYAGFFDPGFGWDCQTETAGSSRGVLEVRSHEVPFLLEHGQTVGWLRYERMAARPNMLYGQELASNYQGQALKLAKHFLPFPE